MMHFLQIMEEILPIGPDEWDEVLARHSTEYSNRSVESIKRKYQDLHRKEVPTGDPAIPQHVRLAKKVKYMIGNRANLGGGGEDYNLEENTFEVAGGHPVGSAGTDQLIAGLMDDPPTASQAGAALDNHNPMPAGISDASVSASISSRPSPIRGRRGDRGQDFISLMQVQMVQEGADRRVRAEEREEARRERAEELAHDRVERAADRAQLNELFATAVGGYMGSQEKKRKRKAKRRRQKRLGLEVSSNSAGTSDDDSSNS